MREMIGAALCEKPQLEVAEDWFRGGLFRGVPCVELQDMRSEKGRFFGGERPLRRTFECGKERGLL